VKPQYVLDGRRTTTLEAFYAEVGQVLLAGQPWGENLDALQGILSGDYGQVPDTFRLIWCNTIVAQNALGYPHTINQLIKRLRDCHPTVLIKTAWALRAALREQGPTVYDWLVELISEHPNVELILIESDFLDE
jgi:RNAse (barnase) inhibitor barstar